MRNSLTCTIDGPTIGVRPEFVSLSGKAVLTTLSGLIALLWKSVLPPTLRYLTELVSELQLNCRGTTRQHLTCGLTVGTLEMGNGAERPFPISFRPRIGQRLHLKSIFPRHSRGDRFHSVSFLPPDINKFILGTIFAIHPKNSAYKTHFPFYTHRGIKICKIKNLFVSLQEI